MVVGRRGETSWDFSFLFFEEKKRNKTKGKFLFEKNGVRGGGYH